MTNTIKMTSPEFIAIRENNIKTCESNIELYKKNNLSLDKLIEHVKNQPTKGFLKLDKNNEIYLKKELTMGIIMGKHNIKHSKLPESIRNLGVDLKFGSMMSREEIISRIETQKEKNENGIKTNENVINNQNEQIAKIKETHQKKSSEVLRVRQEIEESKKTSTQEEPVIKYAPSFETIPASAGADSDMSSNRTCADGSPKPSLRARTTREDGTPIPKKRTDLTGNSSTTSSLSSPSSSISKHDSYPIADNPPNFEPPAVKPVPPPKPPRKNISAKQPDSAQDTTTHSLERQRFMDLIRTFEPTDNGTTIRTNG